MAHMFRSKMIESPEGATDISIFNTHTHIYIHKYIHTHTSWWVQILFYVHPDPWENDPR